MASALCLDVHHITNLDNMIPARGPQTAENDYRRRHAACHRRTPETPHPNNLRVLCEPLQLPKPLQVEFKARIIAVQFQAHAQKLAGSDK